MRHLRSIRRLLHLRNNQRNSLHLRRSIPHLQRKSLSLPSRILVSSPRPDRK